MVGRVPRCGPAGGSCGPAGGSSGPDAVTRWIAGGNPGVPKRVENEISLFWRGPPASLRTFVIRALP